MFVRLKAAVLAAISPAYNTVAKVILLLFVRHTVKISAWRVMGKLQGPKSLYLFHGYTDGCLHRLFPYMLFL